MSPAVEQAVVDVARDPDTTAAGRRRDAVAPGIVLGVRSVVSWFCRQERRAEVDRVEVDDCRSGRSGCSCAGRRTRRRPTIAHGSVIWTPPFHWTDVGSFGSYWIVFRAGPRRQAGAPGSAAGESERSSVCDVGGLPAMLMTELPNGRS